MYYAYENNKGSQNGWKYNKKNHLFHLIYLQKITSKKLRTNKFLNRYLNYPCLSYGKFLFKKPSTKDIKWNVFILGQVIKIVVFLKGPSILYFIVSLFIVCNMHFTKIHSSKNRFQKSLVF